MALNDAGQGVGYSNFNTTPANHTFLWRADSGMLDLSAFGPGAGPGESSAADVNNHAQVVGLSILNGAERARHRSRWPAAAVHWNHA